MFSRTLLVALTWPLLFLLIPMAAGAQTSTSPLPRTPGGKPDMQGTWTNASVTPFERPPELAGRAFVTEAEAAQWEALVRARSTDASRRPDDVANVNEGWLDAGSRMLKTRQTSLVVDPPDGIVPLRPEAEAKKEYNLARNGDWTVYMSPWDRCISRGVPGSIFPASYNNAYRIMQTPEYVVIVYEMIHDARLIPIDKGPHVGDDIRLWMGDSRGRWEGDTLVVETTNFNGKAWIASSSRNGRMRGIGQSDKSRVVERFTLMDVNTINYEVTIEDPEVYTRPWKAAFPMSRDDEYQILEYACHEGNYAVPNILSGARAEENAATTAASR